MLAMNYRGFYRVRVSEKAIPAIEHPEDAIVKVTRSCIYGSDLHIYHGMVPDTRVGSTFGHEFTKFVLPRLIEHVEAGRINPKEIITHRVPLKEVAYAYRIFSEKRDGCIKTVLIPSN